MKRKKKIGAFHSRLMEWFAEQGRDLPWRKTRDPYRILVSEVMLQQTQVDRVIPKYSAFLKRFPTVRALAASRDADVIHEWSGLGYNRRALFLKRAAKIVATEHVGVFPKTIPELERLPGVGKYTARALATFAYQHDAAPVDTNIARVLHRWFYGVDAPKRKKTMRQLERLAEKVLPRNITPPNHPLKRGGGAATAYTWNHALMDFGAMVCTAKRPKCDGCPMRDLCAAYPRITTIQWTGIALKKTKIFKDSDRYLRGRIIEILRHALRHRATVRELDILFQGMCPKERLEKIVEGLSKDALLVRKGTTVSLPM